jgi:hypothetical protein
MFQNEQVGQKTNMKKRKRKRKEEKNYKRILKNQ